MNRSENKVKIRKSPVDRVIAYICTIIVLVCFITFLYPVIYVFISSISTVSMRFNGTLIPKRVSFEGFHAVFENEQIWRSLLNSILYTTVGTLFSMGMTILLAYATSVRNFRYGNIVTFMLVFTMYFSGGMIPTYLVIKKLGLLNTMWALILPSAVSVYNVFLLKSHFQTKISSEIYDAACIDGCGHFRFLLTFAIPLSKSILSVLALFYAVSYWNSYFEASIYITDKTKQPFACVLNDILIKNRQTSMDSVILSQSSDVSNVERMQLLDYALVVISIVPVFIILFIVRKAFRTVSFQKKK